ncbi:hypothetical protein [Bradyrhizobium sp. USDA 4506]
MVGPTIASRIATEHLQTVQPASHHTTSILTTTSWDFIIQDIVRRSPTLECVLAVSSFACSRMPAVSTARSL